MLTIPRRNEARSRRATLVAAISVALHLAALSALLGAQLWNVQAVEEPPQSATFSLIFLCKP